MWHWLEMNTGSDGALFVEGDCTGGMPCHRKMSQCQAWLTPIPGSHWANNLYNTKFSLMETRDQATFPSKKTQ